MKLCMMIGALTSGGAERVASTLANHWARKGWEITIITLSGADQDFYTLAPNVKRRPLDLAAEGQGPVSGLRNNVLRINALRHALLKEQADIALGFLPSCNILCGLACMGTNIVTFGSEHTHPPMAPIGRPWACLRRLVYPRLTAVSGLTERSAGWLRAHTGAKSVPVMPNPIAYPIPHGEPALEPNELKARLGGKNYLLAVGRLVNSKGFDRLLAAFARLHTLHKEWRLIILGEGPLRQALENQRDELGLAAAVALPGAVGNVGEWYEACDAYVMTSLFEGFGNTLAEALAYGLPAVAVDCEAGPREIVRHETDGLLVPQDDPQALDAALHEIMSNPTLRSQFSRRAIQARDRFSVNEIATKWEALFNANL